MDSYVPRCSRARAHALLLHYVPVLGWLPRYPVRDWLLGDLLSGLSVAIMQLPQGELTFSSLDCKLCGLWNPRPGALAPEPGAWIPLPF